MEMEVMGGDEPHAAGRPSSMSNNHNKSSSSIMLKVIAVLVVGMVVVFGSDFLSVQKQQRGSMYSFEEKTPTPLDDSTAKATPTAVASAPKHNNNRNNDKDGRVTYYRRGQPTDDNTKNAMEKKWGTWSLVDSKQKKRPTNDFYQDHPHRDIPRSQFPKNAWQLDQSYVKEFLEEGLALVDRAKKAILAEYGNLEEIFLVEQIPDDELTKAEGLQPGRRGAAGRDSITQGGWTTPRSWDGLKKRLLHAVMTEDAFVFAMAGHSSAAGHGNHFQQSYTAQIQWILEAVFARLGVRHQSRNFGNGGLGVIQHAMAAGSIFGPDVDMLMWDSSMTENVPGFIDIMTRQQVLGGSKVPVLWSLAGHMASEHHEKLDMDVGYPGSGYGALPVGKTLEEIEAMPWAMQYVSCNTEMAQICRDNEYMGTCWIERDDMQTPANHLKQDGSIKQPGGRAKWHPGNRKHQVTGRIIAYTILDALGQALQQWKDAPNLELPDEAWHVTPLYERVRAKLPTLTDKDLPCDEKMKEMGLEWMCTLPVKGRSEFMPRAFPTVSNIRSLMHPDQAKLIPNFPRVRYNPPDVFNPNLHPPAGSIDVLSIVEAGVDFQSVLNPDYHTNHYAAPTFSKKPLVPPGKGFEPKTFAGSDTCDGTIDSWCKRGYNDECLLYGHNDGRTGLFLDGLSGWMVLTIPDLKYGHISIKVECWHPPETIQATEKWTTINGERRQQRHLASTDRSNSSASLLSSPLSLDSSLVPQQQEEEDFLFEAHRQLKYHPRPYCDDFKFEVAINGKTTETWNLDEFETRRKQVARVVEVITLLDDPTFVKDGEEVEVEVAFRISGCQRDKTFSLNHVYWA